MTQLLALLLISLFYSVATPPVNVKGAMKNIMMKGDLKAYANLDTFSKENLYGLGPAKGLKGELMVLNGTIYSTEKRDKEIVNRKNDVTNAAMLVYSYVAAWKEVEVQANVLSYLQLENLVALTAKQNGLDTTVPFAFRIEGKADRVQYHIIDWEKGVKHTMENHKKFAWSGTAEDSNVILLGFYSDHHKTIFTHHTTNMHIHVLNEKTSQVGHLDNIHLNSTVTIFLPVL